MVLGAIALDYSRSELSAPPARGLGLAASSSIARPSTAWGTKRRTVSGRFPWYGVRNVPSAGVYASWGEALAAFSGHSGEEHKGFESRDDALSWVAAGRRYKPQAADWMAARIHGAASINLSGTRSVPVLPQRPMSAMCERKQYMKVGCSEASCRPTSTEPRRPSTAVKAEASPAALEAEPPPSEEHVVVPTSFKNRRISAVSRAPLQSGKLMDEVTMADQLPKRVLQAVTAFDRRHAKHVARADHLLIHLSSHPTWKRACERFGTEFAEIRRNRFFVNEPYNPFDNPASKRNAGFVKRKKWNLKESIWINRPLVSNSNDFFETPDSLRRLLLYDWGAIKESHGLDRFISKSGEAGPDEVEQVREILWKHARTLYGTFDYFAALMSDNLDAAGEPDVYNMSFSAYMDFCRMAQLAHKKDMPSSELEILWVLVNAQDRNKKNVEEFTSQRYFNRQQFIEMIVRVAIMRYVRSGKMSRPADALEFTCHQHLVACMPAECFQNSNNFRSTYCYLPNVDSVLRRHKSTLRTLFLRYANVDENPRMVSIAEWLNFLEDIGLLGIEPKGIKQVTSLEAKLIFLWSRIRATTATTPAEKVRLRHLYWEDFLEALVRLSMVIALPTDNDLTNAATADAGEFLLELRAFSDDEYCKFVESRKGSWRLEPKQKIWRCLDHLAMLIVRTIERSTSKVKKHNSALNSGISDDQASQFVNRRRSGIGLHHEFEKKKDGEGAPRIAVNFIQMMELGRRQLLGSLRKVGIFAELDERHIVLLRDSMVEAPFARGEMVFEQGDEGDSFYVILDGEFEVLISQGDNGELVVGTMGAGAFFGERALLEDKPRAASIRCKVDGRTMAITRDQFELALGAPLKDLLPGLVKDTTHSKEKDSLLSFGQFAQVARILEKQRALTDGELRRYFDSFGLDSSGKLDLKKYLDHLRTKVEANDVDNAYVEIGFEDFVSLTPLCDRSYKGTKEELRKTFDRAKKKSSGCLNLEGFEEALKLIKSG